ncbi:MAG: hypothetical protein OXT69_11185 [Candidatus Poribacteria bacterium]|nr:hypothetical protein [Candidatus Poribacteria bacterium]
MGPLELQVIVLFICLVSFGAIGVVIVDKVGQRNGAKERDPELEQIKQEMALLRERMDKQYADMTLMLEDARRERELEKLRQPDTE